MQHIIDRFIRYVKIDTQSDPNNPAFPSTEKQWDLAHILVKELEQIGRYMKELNIDTGVIINFPQPTVSPKTTVDFVIGKMADVP